MHSCILSVKRSSAHTPAEQVHGGGHVGSQSTCFRCLQKKDREEAILRRPAPAATAAPSGGGAGGYLPPTRRTGGYAPPSARAREEAPPARSGEVRAAWKTSRRGCYHCKMEMLWRTAANGPPYPASEWCFPERSVQGLILDDSHHLLQEPSRWGRRDGAPAAGADRPERSEARQGERPAEDDRRAAWAPSRTTGPGAAPAGELPWVTRAFTQLLTRARVTRRSGLARTAAARPFCFPGVSGSCLASWARSGLCCRQTQVAGSSGGQEPHVCAGQGPDLAPALQVVADVCRCLSSPDSTLTERSGSLLPALC